MKIAKFTDGAGGVPMGDLAPGTLAFLRKTAPDGVTYERATATAPAPAQPATKRPHRKTSLPGDPPAPRRPDDVPRVAPTGDVAEPTRGSHSPRPIAVPFLTLPPGPAALVAELWKEGPAR